MNGLTIAQANSMLRQCNAVDTILLFYLFSLRFACLYKNYKFNNAMQSL